MRCCLHLPQLTNWRKDKCTVTRSIPIWGSFQLTAPQEQLNQLDFGGSVWESNPPFDPRRTESPALKTGKVTGPLSPPE